MTTPKLSKDNQKLRDMLLRTPRHLGQVNEMRLLASGGTIWMCILTGLLLVFMHFIGVNAGLVDMTRFFSPGVTNGKVIDVYESNASVNDESVMAVEFSYEVDEKPLKGFSHTLRGVPSPGQRVDVEYNKSNPAISRIVGTNYGQMGPIFTLIMLAIPFGCFLMAVYFIRRGLKWRKLLCTGEVGEAVYTRMEPTGTTINDQRVFRLYFDMTANNTTREIMVKTHKTENLLDDPMELVLFDPTDPTKFFMWDQIPCAFTMTTPGQWETTSSLIGPIIRLLIGLGFLGSGLYFLVQTIISG